MGERKHALSWRTKIGGLVAFCVIAGAGGLAVPLVRAQQSDALLDPTAKVGADVVAGIGRPHDKAGPIHWAAGGLARNISDIIAVNEGTGEGYDGAGSVWFDVELAQLKEDNINEDQYIVFADVWWHTNHDRLSKANSDAAKAVLRITSTEEGLPNGTRSSESLSLKEDEDGCTGNTLGGTIGYKDVASISYEREWKVCDEAVVKLDDYGTNFAQWSTPDVRATEKWAMYFVQFVPEDHIPTFTTELFVPRASSTLNYGTDGYFSIKPADPEILQIDVTTAGGGTRKVHPSAPDDLIEWRAPYPEVGPRSPGQVYGPEPAADTPAVPEDKPDTPDDTKPDPVTPKDPEPVVPDKPDPVVPDKPEPVVPDKPEPAVPENLKQDDPEPTLLDPKVLPRRDGGDCSGKEVYKKEIKADDRVAATVTINYNPASGKNCALLTRAKDFFAGKETYFYLQLRNEDGDTSTDANYYPQEAGPVWVSGKDQCISYTASMLNPARTRWVFENFTESDLVCD